MDKVLLSKHNLSVIQAVEKGYKVINGQVFYRGKRINPYLNGTKYLRFSFRDAEGKQRKIQVHKVVAYQKYGISMFEKGIQVRHLNGNELDNKDENIAIGTSSENHMDKPDEVRKKVASQASKKHNHQDILNMRSMGYGYARIMKETGITSKGTLSFIINKSMAAGN